MDEGVIGWWLGWWWRIRGGGVGGGRGGGGGHLLRGGDIDHEMCLDRDLERERSCMHACMHVRTCR